jgi:hypothetical protein
MLSSARRSFPASPPQPVRLHRAGPGRYTHPAGFTVERDSTFPRIWILTFPDGSSDGCESLQHARDVIDHELWLGRA